MRQILAVAGHNNATAYNLYKVVSPASIGVNYLGYTMATAYNLNKVISPTSTGVNYQGKSLVKSVRVEL